MVAKKHKDTFMRKLNVEYRRITGNETLKGVKLSKKISVVLAHFQADKPGTKAELVERTRKLIGASKGAPSHKTAKPKKARAVKKIGGASFYASWEWKQLRYEAFKAYGRRCQCCGWRPGDTDGGYLVVDHIKPRSKHPKLQLDLSNLQVLCNDCNMGKSNIYEDDFRDEWPDEEHDPLTAQFMATMQ